MLAVHSKARTWNGRSSDCFKSDVHTKSVVFEHLAFEKWWFQRHVDPVYPLKGWRIFSHSRLACLPQSRLLWSHFGVPRLVEPANLLSIFRIPWDCVGWYSGCCDADQKLYHNDPNWSCLCSFWPRGKLHRYELGRKSQKVCWSDHSLQYSTDYGNFTDFYAILKIAQLHFYQWGRCGRKHPILPLVSLHIHFL